MENESMIFFLSETEFVLVISNWEKRTSFCSCKNKISKNNEMRTIKKGEEPKSLFSKKVPSIFYFFKILIGY